MANLWDELVAKNPDLPTAGELGWHAISGDAPWPSDDELAALEGA